MRILVTGAKGQVGSELIQQGERLGLQMLGADRAELDITHRNAVHSYIQVQQPDIVINAAAYTAVDRAESESDLAYAINRDGVTYLAQACSENDIPLFHISTDYVFDGNRRGSYSETDLSNPINTYGNSKLEGDNSIESILKKHIILRVSWVFGANGNNFVKTILRLGRERDVIRVVSDQYGGPTWAGAIACTLLSIAKRWDNGEDILWGTYHYSGQPTASWYTFAKTILEQAEKLGVIDNRPNVEPITTSEYSTMAQRPLNTVLNCQKIAEVLNVTQPDWRTDLSQVLTNLRAQ
ncbi:MAG: dTDP-4-dehydrorhamnose reductase [Pseudomonadota bacterium]